MPLQVSHNILLVFCWNELFAADNERVRRRTEDGSTVERRHPCDRECVAGEPMVCRYDFEVEMTGVLSKACYDCPLNLTHCSAMHCNPGDGVERSVVTVNRALPGPGIVVCAGDTVEVVVTNKLPAITTSVHWHGLYMHGHTGHTNDDNDATTSPRQPKLELSVPDPSPWSDGVPGVTQCPILPGQRFRYNFVANPAGTHWWHSHAALQREDGMYGPLIVRQPPQDNPHRLVVI